jgi:trigger factor
MPHTINRISDVEYELEVEASAEEIAPELDSAVKKQRARTSLNGFRPGKVPTQLVKRMYGRELAYGVADDLVQRTYRENILKGEGYDVLGQPTITDLDYEYGGDLKAKVRFGVRPTFEITSLEGVEVSRLEHTISQDEVAEELELLREQQAELTPVEGPTTRDSFLLTDIYEIDEESGEMTGDHRHDVAFFLGSEDLLDETRDALLGMEEGDAVRVKLLRHEDDSEALFEVRLKTISLRDLPDLDDDFASTFSQGSIETMEALREQLAEKMQGSVDQTSRELFEGGLIHAVLERHEFDVPESVVDMYLDGRLAEFKKQAGDRLPEDFDEEAFKEAGREDSARQARWMFVRDRVTKDEAFSVSEEDRLAFFAKTATSDGLTPEFMMQYYRSMPKMMSQLDDRLLTQKVVDFFAAQATVVAKDKEAMEAEAKTERGE